MWNNAIYPPMFVPSIGLDNIVTYTNVSLPPQPVQESNMYHGYAKPDVPMAVQKHNFFMCELDTIAREKMMEARERFNIDGNIPDTMEEAIQWVKDGKYTIHPEQAVGNFYTSDFGYVFNFTANVENKDGYADFCEKLGEAKKDAIKKLWSSSYSEDDYWDCDYNESYVINEFKNWSYTPPKKAAPAVDTTPELLVNSEEIVPLIGIIYDDVVKQEATIH